MRRFLQLTYFFRQQAACLVDECRLVDLSHNNKLIFCSTFFTEPPWRLRHEDHAYDLRGRNDGSKTDHTSPVRSCKESDYSGDDLTKSDHSYIHGLKLASDVHRRNF